MFTDRKSSYKLPPTAITDRLVSQESRRSKALEEQKRKRAQRIDSSRQLDLFADLNLGPSDDERKTISEKDSSGIPCQGLAPFASMLESSVPSKNLQQPSEHSPAMPKTKKKSNKQKAREKGEGRKPNKWADRCMYAELLEMTQDDPWSVPAEGGKGREDGLPDDLESGWVAVAPVPVGKRCLAVTHQSSGLSGIVPNTTLRSRVLGKSLISPFPSSLPPLTILDCILDPNWRDNGILHILDVVKWKGQDVGDCEAPFRFWWRDTRLAEIPRSPPPSIYPTTTTTADTTIPQNFHPPLDPPQTTPAQQSNYRFPYPITFLPVPYYTDATLTALFCQIIPLARSSRWITVDIPSVPNARLSPIVELTMEIDKEQGIPSPSYPVVPTALASVSAEVVADGLLLYVAQASYEPGMSPLSSWIPINGYNKDQTSTALNARSVATEGPLDLFERLVKRRLEKNQSSRLTHPNATMDVDM